MMRLRATTNKYAPPDEISEPPALARDGFGDVLVLFSHQRVGDECRIYTSEDESGTEIIVGLKILETPNPTDCLLFAPAKQQWGLPSNLRMTTIRLTRSITV